jgi:hypothetical protein
MWILTGLVIGGLLGVVLHRGDFCMHSALREILPWWPGPQIRAYLLALAVQLAVVNLIAGLGWLEIPLPPVTPVASLAGGLVFGIGMVLDKG